MQALWRWLFSAADIRFALKATELLRCRESTRLPIADSCTAKFDENFKGVFFAIQKAAPLLAKGGSIVVTTSFLNEVGVPGFSILSATKAAVRSLVRFDPTKSHGTSMTTV